MEHAESEAYVYIGREPQELRNILSADALEISRLEEQKQALIQRDSIIRDLLHDAESEAVLSLVGAEMDDEVLVSLYEAFAVRFDNSHTIQHVEAVRKQKQLLLPDVPFIAERDEERNRIRKVARVSDAVRYVVEPPIEYLVRSERGSMEVARKIALLALSVSTTDGISVIVGPRDQIGYDVVSERVDSFNFHRNATYTLESLDKAMSDFEFIGNTEGVAKAQKKWDELIQKDE
jgi:hypothetical protein